ncbi:MAG: hypothetical protein JNK89_01205, partial [Saprospiraceae bacterium]|nr:hypothetical protein [Saprospiraceae bacterium]
MPLRYTLSAALLCCCLHPAGAQWAVGAGAGATLSFLPGKPGLWHLDIYPDWKPAFGYHQTLLLQRRLSARWSLRAELAAHKLAATARIKFSDRGLGEPPLEGRITESYYGAGGALMLTFSP